MKLETYKYMAGEIVHQVVLVLLAARLTGLILIPGTHPAEVIPVHRMR